MGELKKAGDIRMQNHLLIRIEKVILGYELSVLIAKFFIHKDILIKAVN